MSGLQGGSLDSILDIFLSKNWSNTLRRSSILVSGYTWIGIRPRRLLASLNIANMDVLGRKILWMVMGGECTMVV